MGKTILTIKERSRELPCVDIFGTSYPFLTTQGSKGEIVAGARLKTLARQIGQLNLTEIEDLSEEAAEEATSLLDKFVKIILPTLPATVLSELADMEKLSIAEVYIKEVTELPASQTPGATEGRPVALAEARRNRVQSR